MERFKQPSPLSNVERDVAAMVSVSNCPRGSGTFDVDLGVRWTSWP